MAITDQYLIDQIRAGEADAGVEGLKAKYGHRLTQWVLTLSRKLHLSPDDVNYVIRETWFAVELHIEDGVDDVPFLLRYVSGTYMRRIASKSHVA